LKCGYGNGRHSNDHAPCNAISIREYCVATKHNARHHSPEATVIKAIKFVGVPVSDQQRALDFYTKTLGFRVITDQPFDDKQRWIELGIGRSSSGITLFTPEGQENRIGSFTGISFVADDVEATYDELAAKGVNFIQKPERADWGTAAVFADPDGNQFVLGSA
jgi:catechol 2,3-dioxygenase-like lactoylglutathione lyase family enzyme